MATLLEVVNRVLMKIGEGRVGSVGQSTTSRLCAENVRVALLALVDESNDWPWLHQTFNASSWSGDTATLPGTVANIQFIRDEGARRVLHYMSELDFSTRQPVAYTGTNGGAWWWSFSGDGVRFDPYPNDTDSRADILFHGSIIFTLPTLDADVLQVADRDINALVFRTCVLMATDHLMDTNRAEMYLMEYRKAIQMAKSRMTTDNRRSSAIW